MFKLFRKNPTIDFNTNPNNTSFSFGVFPTYTFPTYTFSTKTFSCKNKWRDNLLSPFDFNRNTGNLGLLFKVEISNDSINEPIPIKIFGKDYCKLTSSTILPNSFPHTLYLEPPKTSKPITIAFYQLFRNINSLQSYPNLYQTQPEDSTSDYSITDLMIPVLEIKTNTLVSSSSEPLLQNSSELTQHIILNKRSELRSREPSDSDFEIDSNNLLNY